jgi:hypothetical protein
MKKEGIKILLLDIETTPIIGYTWTLWETNVIKIKQDSYILCCAVKWLGEKGKVLSLPDYPLYRKEPHNDRSLVVDIWKYLDEADVVLAHNGISFDIKKINGRIFEHRLPPPSPYETIDTLKTSRNRFALSSNKLNELAKKLGLGQKKETGGFDLWLGCMDGDKKSWKKMTSYNLHDVVLLEKVYEHLRPWMKTHPNLSPYSRDPKHTCTRCGSTRIHSRGTQVNKGVKSRRLQCQDCTGWMKAPLDINKTKQNLSI